jgi:hypothetical protein
MQASIPKMGIELGICRQIVMDAKHSDASLDTHYGWDLRCEINSNGCEKY